MQQALLAAPGITAPPASFAYQAAYTSPTIAGLTATQTGVAFGAVGASRLIVIAVNWVATVNTSVLSSATIGGVSVPTIITGTRLGPNVSSNYQYVAFIAAFVPTGTTGTVVANFTGGGSIGVQFFAYQALNIISATAYATGQNSSTTAPISTTCNLAAGGVVFASCDTTSTTTISWTGVTKSYEVSLASGVSSGGGATSATTVTGSSFQFNDSGGTSGSPSRSIFVAAFR